MADRNITGQLKTALAIIDTRVLDHIIVGGSQMVSFAERGPFESALRWKSRHAGFSASALA